jgi:hypothetical protein
MIGRHLTTMNPILDTHYFFIMCLCHGVGIAVCIVVQVGVRVWVSSGSGRLKNTRIIERT